MGENSAPVTFPMSEDGVILFVDENNTISNVTIQPDSLLQNRNLTTLDDIDVDSAVAMTEILDTDRNHPVTVSTDNDTEVGSVQPGGIEDERLQEAELIINLQRATQRVDVSVTGGEVSQKREDTETATNETITIERKKYHECYICKMRFKSITTLFKHRVAHNERVQNTFNCDICNQVFTDPSSLEKHKYLHIEVRVLRCGICLETFFNSENYNYHIRVHDSEGPYVCNICSKVFNKKQQYLTHHYEHNPSGTPPPKNVLQCDVCHKVFPEAHKLKRHMMYHNGEKYHSCVVCQKKFVERSKLTRHMLTHSGKREFVCPVCSKSFTLKFNMQQHMNIHKGVRPHQCNMCGKSFTQRVVMQRHMKVHEEQINATARFNLMTELCEKYQK